MKLLHIIASPRGPGSRSIKVSTAFLEHIRSLYPGLSLDEIDLFKESLPPLEAVRVGGKYTLLAGGELTGDAKSKWEPIEEQINRFLRADIYLLSVPMWNFGIPYVLKHYIDVIVQPRYLFRYTENGPEGLAKNKRMFIVTSRGGDYSETGPAHSLDHQEPYLRTVFGFVGIHDIVFVNLQGMDVSSPAEQEKKIRDAVVRLNSLELAAVNPA